MRLHCDIHFEHPRTWFKAASGKCFAINCSKAVTPLVFVFVICLLSLSLCLFKLINVFTLTLYFFAAWGGYVFWLCLFLICIFITFFKHQIDGAILIIEKASSCLTSELFPAKTVTFACCYIYILSSKQLKSALHRSVYKILHVYTLKVYRWCVFL